MQYSECTVHNAIFIWGGGGGGGAEGGGMVMCKGRTLWNPHLSVCKLNDMYRLVLSLMVLLLLLYVCPLLQEQEDTTAFAFASAFHNSTGGARGSLGASSSFSLGSGSDLGMLSSSLPDSTFLSPEGDDFAASANLSPSQIPVVSVSSVDDNHTQTLVSLQPDGSRPWVDPETERMLDAVVAREEMNGALVTEVPVQTPQEIWNDLFVPGSNQVEGLLQRQDGGRDEFLFPEACQLRPGENVPATTTSQMLEAYGIAGQYGQAFERTALSAGDIHLAPLHPGTPTSLTSLSPSPQPPGQRLSPSPSISPSPQPRGP